MRFMRFVGRKLKFLVDVPTWMSYRDLRSHGSNIFQIAVSIFRRPHYGRRESYEEAVSRLQLTQADLLSRQRQLFVASLLYGALALGLAIYSIYLFFIGHFAGGLLALVVTAMASALGYKESFCYMQMRQRRLGCTWRDWVKQFTR